MAAIEPGPDGAVLRTAEWAKVYEAFPALVAARVKAEEQALADFLAKRIAEFPEAERAAAATGDLADDLRRRLRDAAHAALADPGRSVTVPSPNGEGTSGEGPDILFPGFARDGADLLVDASVLEAWLLSSAMKEVWPDVLRTWRNAHRASPAGIYRAPFPLREAHRALGGKQHGKDRGYPARVSASTLTIGLPKRKGCQAELELGTRVRPNPEDYGPDGKLAPAAILRMVRDATGPQLAMIGHAAFALAEEDARADDRPFDGRFWFWPSRIAKLLGYANKDATAKVREQFAAYANTTIRGSWRLYDGTTIEMKGSILYPTNLEAAVTAATAEKGKPGRSKLQEWRIRDYLVDLARNHYAPLPVSLLNCGDVDPRTWALSMRVYEELAFRFRYAAAATTAGEPVKVGLLSLSATANVSGDARAKRSLRLADVAAHLDRLQKRGAIRWTPEPMADGEPGALVTLSDEMVRAKLGEVAAARTAHLAAGRRRQGGRPGRN